MAKRLVDVDAVQFRRVFPWVNLFRAFRIAIDIRKVILAALALVAIAAGNAAFQRLPFAPPASAGTRWPWNERIGIANPVDVPEQFLEDPQRTLVRVFTDWRTPLLPLETVVPPARALFQPRQTWSHVAFAWTQLLWALGVWALFAGAITRLAAVQFADDGKAGMWASLRFAGENFVSYLSAPLLPLVGIGALWLVCLLGGLVGRIPVAGPMFVGGFWWLALGIGLLMSLIVAGVAAGWPLMYAAISAEGSDGYDGFSRAYAYVFSRPWHYLWFAVVALVYGSALVVFVTFVASLGVYLASWSVAGGMGAEATQSIVAGNPQLFGGHDILDGNTAIDPSLWGITSAGLWMQVLAILVAGFVASYFWSASTIIYFLLRESDDATDLHDVYMPEEVDEDELLPLVGVADSSQPVIERPLEGDFTPPRKADGTEDTEFDIRTGQPSGGSAKE